MPRGLLDTSIFIALETGRQIESESIPDESAISPVTLGELRVGVHTAKNTTQRATRLDTFLQASKFAQLPIDDSVAEAWTLIRTHLGETGGRAHVNDTWIAATALAHEVPVFTQDHDFGQLDGIGGLAVVKL